MENTKKFIEQTQKESDIDIVDKLTFLSNKKGEDFCFYEFFALKGITVDRVEPGLSLVVCSFKVPPRLTDRSGKLARGAIVNLVDEVGYAVIHAEGLPVAVSVDMSISFLSTADVQDELEITSRLLGKRGRYSGTIVVIKNKTTGQLIAEGRHSLFSSSIQPSKL